MFRLLGKINIASQLMLLVAAVAGLAIFVVSRAAESRSQNLLLERSRSSLADECLLRGFAMREAIRTLSRDVRETADRLDRALRVGGAGHEQALEQIFHAPADRQDDSDRSVVQEVCLVRFKEATGEIVNLNPAMRREGDRAMITRLAEDRPSNPAAADLWGRLRRGVRGVGPTRQGGMRQLQSGLRRESPDAPAYLLAIGYSMPADAAGTPVLIVTLNFTRLVENQARRLPRHLLFVQDEAGVWVYHPDAERIGTSEPEWPSARSEEHPSPVELQRGMHLGVREMDNLRYYTVRKRLPEKLTHNREITAQLEQELRELPGLRFSRLWEGATSLVLSCRTTAVLDQAIKKVELHERRATQAPAAPPPTPILCERFVGHQNRLWLDADQRLPISVILAGAEEEMTAEVHAAIARLWYRWFIPVLLASASLALVAAYLLTRPLRRLTEASQRLAQGDYSVDVQVVAPGEVGELARTFRDMTNRIRTRERELRENLARMNTILINAADGIITFDQTGRIEQANAAAEEMFGFVAGGMSGTKVQRLMKLPEHLQKPVPFAAFTQIGAANPAAGGTVTQLCNAVKTPGEEHRGLRQDGATFWMEVTFSQVPLEDRRVITGIFRDVTQRKLAEERIRQMNDELDARVRLRTAQLEDTKAKLEVALSEAESASAAKDRFISVVSHELRTPLTSAMGYTDLLLNPRATKLRENPVPTLEKVLTACKYLSTLINDLLDVSRYTAGKAIDLSPSRFELAPFLKGVQEMVAPLVKKNANVLEATIPPGMGELVNDETRLRQILLNLLSNAAKFTEAGKVSFHVERRHEPDGDVMVFTVSDTGAGLTPEQQEKLFTPFYRVDNSTTRKQGGTGLGLAITKMLCELMGGKITLDSAPGKGSTFTVTVPAEVTGKPRRHAGIRPSESGERRPPRGTVLVIDDDQTVRHMLETYLVQEGHHVVLAASGEEGLQLAREHQPMCITLDVLMPNEDGWDVLARLKNDPVTRDIPVIMLTIMEERNRGFALGATEYVTKPIDWGRLGSILCRYNPGQAPILIVEDDSLQRGYLREELILAGWTVMEASNGVEGLKVCETTTPSLILLDLTMPIMDGFTFLDELRRREGGADIPVVVLTARELSDEERRRLNRSVAQVLAKESLEKDRLLGRIREQMQAAVKG